MLDDARHERYVSLDIWRDGMFAEKHQRIFRIVG
jgi:hypothetical protein